MDYTFVASTTYSYCPFTHRVIHMTQPHQIRIMSDVDEVSLSAKPVYNNLFLMKNTVDSIKNREASRVLRGVAFVRQ